MYGEFNNPWWYGSSNWNPAYKKPVHYGYDRYSPIATAQIAPSPYTTQPLIIAKLGGLSRLIESVDDSNPPTGSLNPNVPPNNPAYVCYNSVLQTVTTEINGYLSSIYPIPLVQTGTICVLAVSALSTDGLGAITAVDVIQAGNYLTPPAAANSPVYLEYIDSRNEGTVWAQINNESAELTFIGTGAQLTVGYTPFQFSDESGQVITTQQVTIAPVITNGGQHYQLGELLVLVGGTSVVPAIVRQSMLDLVCHTLYKRRFSPDEKNPFSGLAQMWRKKLKDVSEFDAVLDGTYKRFFSSASSWNTESVLNGANSL